MYLVAAFAWAAPALAGNGHAVGVQVDRLAWPAAVVRYETLLSEKSSIQARGGGGRWSPYLQPESFNARQDSLPEGETVKRWYYEVGIGYRRVLLEAGLRAGADLRYLYSEQDIRTTEEVPDLLSLYRTTSLQGLAVADWYIKLGSWAFIDLEASVGGVVSSQAGFPKRRYDSFDTSPDTGLTYSAGLYFGRRW